MQDSGREPDMIRANKETQAGQASRMGVVLKITAVIVALIWLALGLEHATGDMDEFLIGVMLVWWAKGMLYALLIYGFGEIICLLQKILDKLEH